MHSHSGSQTSVCIRITWRTCENLGCWALSQGFWLSRGFFCCCCFCFLQGGPRFAFLISSQHQKLLQLIQRPSSDTLYSKTSPGFIIYRYNNWTILCLHFLKFIKSLGLLNCNKLVKRMYAFEPLDWRAAISCVRTEDVLVQAGEILFSYMAQVV